MSNADSSETRLAYVPESAWNTTPATPGFINARMTSEDFQEDKNTGISNEIRADAEVSDLVRLGISANGGFDFELSHGDFNTLFEHVLRGTFAAAATGATTLDTTAPDQITRAAGSFLKDGFQVGDSVTLAGSTTNDGTYAIEAIAADGLSLTTVEVTLTTEAGSGDETLTAGASDVLKGALEKKSFTFEKTFETGVTDMFFRYTGCRAGQLDLNFTANDFTNGRLAFVGGAGAKAQAAIAGATYTPAGVNPVMTAVDVATVALDGVTTTLYVQSFNISLNNNLRAQNAVGNLGAIGVAYGRREITGSLSAYLNELGADELYDAYANHAAASLLWDVSDGTNTYNFRLPKLKFSVATNPTPGNNQDVFLNLDFTALVDTDAATSIIITK